MLSARLRGYSEADWTRRASRTGFPRIDSSQQRCGFFPCAGRQISLSGIRQPKPLRGTIRRLPSSWPCRRSGRSKIASPMIRAALCATWESLLRIARSGAWRTVWRRSRLGRPDCARASSWRLRSGQQFHVAKPVAVPSCQLTSVVAAKVLFDPLIPLYFPVPPVYSKVPVQCTVSPSHFQVT